MEYHLEPKKQTSILDVLNEDCWRLILDFIDIDEIKRSERVSSQWQHVVIRYLQGVHFSIEYPWYTHEECRNFHILAMERDDPEMLNRITRKWGPYIKKVDCINRDSLQVIAKRCPNLEDITGLTKYFVEGLELKRDYGNRYKMWEEYIPLPGKGLTHANFYGFHDFVLLNGVQRSFKKLKRIHFRGCEYATDKCISKWLVIDSLEELLITMSDQVTGQCFNKLKSRNLRILSLNECTGFELRHILSAVDHLTGLTKLELICVPRKIFENVTSLLDKLPNLEDLCLRWDKKMMVGDEIAEGISRLGLKRLDLSFNPNANDEWLEIIARGCGRLRELLVEGCIGVTARGVLAVCAAANATLRVLHVGSNVKIQYCHVQAFIDTCPDLRMFYKTSEYRNEERLSAKHRVFKTAQVNMEESSPQSGK